MPIKILIVTDSVALPSGLAETTRLIFETLLDLHPGKYDLSQVGLFHCYAVVEPKWPVYPTAIEKGPAGAVRFAPDDRWGQKSVPKAIAKIQPDIVFAFGDPYRVLHLCVPAGRRKHRLILHVNFDGTPLPSTMDTALANADMIVTKSEFSMTSLANALPAIPRNKLAYCYSPADLERFRPMDRDSKAALRRNLFPEWMPRAAFILGWVGRNQWRKQNWLLYKTILYLRSGEYLICPRCGRVSLNDWDPSRRLFARDCTSPSERRPGLDPGVCAHCGVAADRATPLTDIYLWLHSVDAGDEDWPAREMERQFGLTRGIDLHYTEGFELKAALAPQDMPALYQLWDCLLYLSGGEGFGLPAWEAMCCALPAVYTNFSSHAEFLTRASAGLAVGGILQPERKSCLWRMIGDVGQIIEAVRKLYFSPELREQLGRNGRAFTGGFDKRSQAMLWDALFTQGQSGSLPGPQR